MQNEEGSLITIDDVGSSQHDLDSPKNVSKSPTSRGSRREKYRDGVGVRRSGTHSATGASPYCSMFGFEPTFPGWQHLRQDDATSRRIMREEANIHRWMRRKLQEGERDLTQEEGYNPGD
jgi:hypothetical protein